MNDSSTHTNETQSPDMLRAALWYAGRGVSVFPVHEPLFNHPLGYVCTCEEYRHSEKCRTNHRYLYLESDKHCESPGKCPRVRWREKSTTAHDTIKKWWRWWPTANIGIDCGKSGLLVLDVDSYKEQYEGEKFLTRADEETVTTLTGGGGSHLWYKMPEGKTWGNHNNTLPAGIDIRGAGGYVVAAPSLHKSGGRYAFEGGYELGTIDLLPVPDKLAELLDRAAASSPSRAGVTVRFTETTTDWPNLSAFNLSDKTLHTINHPPQIGQRSEADYSVCLALCYAGATDTDILAVFQHYPVGVCGKFAERGPDYLARTVTSARAYVAQNPPQSSSGAVGNGILGKIDALRLRLRSVDFAFLVPEYHPTETDKEGNPLRLQSTTGYRTGDRDRVVADAALDYLWGLGKTAARISGLELSVRTGYSPGACGAAMKRLVNLFQPIAEDKSYQGKQATRYKINDALLCDRIHKEGENILSQSSASVLSTHRAHDVFVRSLSALTPEQLAEKDAKRLAEGVKPMERNRQLAARLAASARALGPAALRLIDILAMYGDLRGVDLAALLYKSTTATRRIISRTIEAGLVVETGTGFDLAGGWSERVTELDAIVPTAGTVKRRSLAASDIRIRHCEKLIDREDKQVEIDKLKQRKEKAESQKWPLIQPDVEAYNERAAAAGLAGVTMADALKPGLGGTFFNTNTSGAVLDERRIGETEKLMLQASVLLETAKRAGGVFWASQLAEYRTVIGRLGLDVSQTVKRAELWG